MYYIRIKKQTKYKKLFKLEGRFGEIVAEKLAIKHSLKHPRSLIALWDAGNRMEAIYKNGRLLGHQATIEAHAIMCARILGITYEH